MRSIYLFVYWVGGGTKVKFEHSQDEIRFKQFGSWDPRLHSCQHAHVVIFPSLLPHLNGGYFLNSQFIFLLPCFFVPFFRLKHGKQNRPCKNKTTYQSLAIVYRQEILFAGKNPPLPFPQKRVLYRHLPVQQAHRILCKMRQS